MWDVDYPHADNLHPMWDNQHTTWDVSNNPMWDVEYPTLDINYLYGDNIKAFLRIQSNIPCGMLIIRHGMFIILSEKSSINYPVWDNQHPM